MKVCSAEKRFNTFLQICLFSHRMKVWEPNPLSDDLHSLGFNHKRAHIDSSSALHLQEVSRDGKSSSPSSAHRQTEEWWLSLCPPLSPVTMDTSPIPLQLVQKDVCASDCLHMWICVSVYMWLCVCIYVLVSEWLHLCVTNMVQPISLNSFAP